MQNEEKLITSRKGGSIAADIENIWFAYIHMKLLLWDVLEKGRTQQTQAFPPMKLLLWDVLEKGRTQQTQAFPPLHDWSGSHSQSIRCFILMPSNSSCHSNTIAHPI
jgi:hypothetical protein